MPADLLALARADPHLRLLRLLGPHQAALVALEHGAGVRARRPITSVGGELADYLATLIRSNPTAQLGDLLARPEVQELINQFLANRVAQSSSAIEAGHLAAYRLALRHAAQEMRVLGLDLPALPVLEATPYLGQVLADLNNTADSVPQRLLTVANSGFLEDVPVGDVPNVTAAQAAARAANVRTEVDREARRLANRVAAGVTVATNRAYTDAQIAAYRAVADVTPGLVARKLWVADLTGNVCPVCAALHGTVISVDEVFSGTVTFGAGNPPPVYQDLIGPPRHPFCRCRIVVHLEQVGEDGPAAMRAQAQEVATRTPGLAPRSETSPDLSDIAQTTDYLTASDVRAPSESRFRAAIDNFRTCLLGRV